MVIPVCWSAYEPEVQGALNILLKGKSSWDEAWEAMSFLCSVAQEGYTVQVFDSVAPCVEHLQTDVLISLLETLMDAHLRARHEGLTNEMMRLLSHDLVDVVMVATFVLHDVLLMDMAMLSTLQNKVAPANQWGFDATLKRLSVEVIL